MKLNRKGYLTVEVILASVAAIAIAFFLMEITIKLVNVTDDAYVNTELLTDKALIIENIKEQLEKDIVEKKGISSITLKTENGKKGYEIVFCNSQNQDDERSLYIESDNLKYTSNVFANANENVLYTKKLNNSLDNIVLAETGDTSNSGYILFKITADNKFSNEPFEATIVVYNDKKC